MGNFIDLNLAKVGIEDSNPFARSSFLENLQTFAFHPERCDRAYVSGRAWGFMGNMGAARFCFLRPSGVLIAAPLPLPALCGDHADKGVDERVLRNIGETDRADRITGTIGQRHGQDD
ncbi:MAG: hypothetical protein RLZZ104_1078 [Pseudomonadota bacterium]